MKVTIDGIDYAPVPPVPEDRHLAALDCEMLDNDPGARTVRDYLHELLATLWQEEEDFSGKRPFGNSGWTHDLYRPLVKGGFVTGSFDEDGYLDDFDREAADALVFDLITAMCYGTKKETP